MPRPTKGESKEDYISRFMASEEARADYPDEKQRAAVAYSMWEHRNRLEELANARMTVTPRLFRSRVIEPGLVYYGDIDETLLVKKEALDKIMASSVGKPVVNEVHKTVDGQNFRDVADGVVTDTWFNQEDGWYWHEFLVWDPATQRNCESGAYGVSCAYVPNDMKAAVGVHNNMPYDEEVVSGEYTHLAVVANPRYEGARIIANSKEDGTMRLMWWKKEKKNAADLDLSKATVLVGEKSIPLQELINSYKKKNPDVNPLENMADDLTVEIDGKEVTVAELKKLHNDAAGEADEDKKKKEAEEKKNAEEAEKKKKEDEEKKNAEEAEKKKKEDEEKEKKNAADNTFRALKNKADLRGEPQKPEAIRSQREGAAEGAKRYGSGK